VAGRVDGAAYRAPDACGPPPDRPGLPSRLHHLMSTPATAFPRCPAWDRYSRLAFDPPAGTRRRGNCDLEVLNIRSSRAEFPCAHGHRAATAACTATRAPTAAAIHRPARQFDAVLRHRAIAVGPQQMRTTPRPCSAGTVPRTRCVRPSVIGRASRRPPGRAIRLRGPRMRATIFPNRVNGGRFIEPTGLPLAT